MSALQLPSKEETAPRVFDVEIIEIIEADDDLLATANFSAGTVEYCKARTG